MAKIPPEPQGDHAWKIQPQLDADWTLCQRLFPLSGLDNEAALKQGASISESPWTMDRR
jgi:hypothetical protein